MGFGLKSHLCSEPAAPRACPEGRCAGMQEGQAVSLKPKSSKKSWSHIPGHFEAAKISPKPLSPHPS